MKNKIRKIVIDINVMVAALRSSRGASHKLMTLLDTGKYKAHLSVSLVLEYEDVLNRNITKMSQKSIQDFLDYFCKVSEHQKIHFLWRPHLKDACDDMVLELAVAAQADSIITYNKKDFCNIDEFGLRALTPKEFLEDIGELK